MVNADDAASYCAERALTYIETSAKTGHQVDYTFTTACHEMIELIKDGRMNYGGDDD